MDLDGFPVMLLGFPVFMTTEMNVAQAQISLRKTWLAPYGLTIILDRLFKEEQPRAGVPPAYINLRNFRVDGQGTVIVSSGRLL